jgi:hypothetical protein
MTRYTLLAAALLAMPIAAHAGDTTIAAGSEYRFVTRMPTGLGPGLALDYVKGDNKDSRGDKPSFGAAGVMVGLPVPTLLRLDLGGKLVYLEAEGPATAAMAGGRLTVDLPMNAEAFVHGFYAGAGASSGTVKEVIDTMAGVRWSPLKMVGVELGYRTVEVKREDARRNIKLADGAYAGVSVAF